MSEMVLTVLIVNTLHNKISPSGHESVPGLQTSVPVSSHSCTNLYTYTYLYLLWNLQLTFAEVFCLRPLKAILQLKIHWTEVQSCFVRVRSYCYVLYCPVCLQLCINLDLSLAVNEISNKYLTIGN